ncbi:MAG: protein translocase subunit SecD [bacterium]|nr:protein translocase subunit SecD [bacterium]
MKNKKKGLLQLLCVVAVIGALTAIITLGIGKWHRGKANNINLGLDLAGGVSITYQAKDDNVSKEDMNLALEKLKQRVQGIAVESDVYLVGENRITVDIPGENDAKKVLETLGKPAELLFKDSEGNTVLTGSDIKSAKGVTQANEQGVNQNVVQLVLNEEGTKKFAEATAANLQKPISIIYDGEEISAPTVQSTITTGEAIITGQETLEEAKALATNINIGALPITLEQVSTQVVGAKLGSNALEKSLFAGVIGFIIVLAFMIIVYRIPGFASSIALVIYVLLVLLALNGLNITLTLPGVAGIILSIGMAVDANVIIFTRIKEEIGKGKTVRSAIKLGFEKALSAIVDGNITTLIAAAVLYFIGTGTIRGFAQTLAIGIILSMFTALVVTKFILNAFFALGITDEKLYGQVKEYKTRNYVGNFGKFAAISGVIILVGIGSMVYHKASGSDILNFGLDFKGGTGTQVTMKEECTEELKNKVSDSVEAVVGEVPQISTVDQGNQFSIKTTLLDADKQEELSKMFVDTYKVDQEQISFTSISSTISNDQKTKAVQAVLVAAVFMLLYIWIRFKDIRFGSAAVIALLHDVMIVVTVYAVLRGLSVGNTFIACILTIVGYSINATIVIFDRIRENYKGNRNREGLREVVNQSISQTFTRSIYTSLTTFIMVFVLYLFGVTDLREFALPLMVGIIGGGYSSICITGSLWYILKTRVGKKKISA